MERLPSMEEWSVRATEISARLYSLCPKSVCKKHWLGDSFDREVNHGDLDRILEIIHLNCTLKDATLCPTMRKPLDVLAEVLISKQSGGNRTPIELFVSGLANWEASIQKLL
jgi:hypothetical protein